jgi:hypothetical protein
MEIKMSEESRKTVRKIRVSRSTVMEVVGFVTLVASIGTFSIPLSGIIGGVLLIVAGGLSA